MDRQANIERFEREAVKINREGITRLMSYIRKSDFYSAPASTRYHLSVTGGLLQHSLNVLDAFRNSMRDNRDGTYSFMVAGKNLATITEESMIIMALLHDLCKTNFYKTVMKWRKDKITSGSNTRHSRWKTKSHMAMEKKRNDDRRIHAAETRGTICNPLAYGIHGNRHPIPQQCN